MPERKRGTKQEKVIGTCRLCLQEDSELQKSHIIPEFHYKDLYDEKHRYYVISNDKNQAAPPRQKGLYERLLCGTCESKLSKWEKYGNEVFNGDVTRKIQDTGNSILVRLDYYNYFKLYQLSLLWRMGIASSEMFKPVTLGKYTEDLRKRILDEDPGPHNDYPCFMTAILVNRVWTPDLITQVTKKKSHHFHHYMIVISGILYHFIAKTNINHPPLGSYALRENGKFLLERREAKDIPFLWDRLKDVIKAI